MSAPRTAIADALKPHFPTDVPMLDYTAQLDNLTRPALVVRLTGVSPDAFRKRWYRASVLVVSHLEDLDPATAAELDQLLEDVLDAVDLTPGLTWTDADRVSVDDTWPGWEVQLKPVPTKHEEGTP